MREYAEKIRERAGALLAEGKVEVFIGYREGSVAMMNQPVLIRKAMRPAFFTGTATAGSICATI